MHGLAALVAATISILSLCKTKMEPALTISDLSSVVLVTWYSDSSFFWMAAVPDSWAGAVHGSAIKTARTALGRIIVFMQVSPSHCVGKTRPIISRYRIGPQCY